MGNAGICDRCGGKGWLWTGSRRVPCTARLCGSSTTPPPDPARDAFDLIPVDRWPEVSARLRRRR